jgi:hypothetical protein
MSNEEVRKPGYYWVRKPKDEWEIVRVEHVRGEVWIEAMGWDGGARLPSGTEWGPMIRKPSKDRARGAPPNIAGGRLVRPPHGRPPIEEVPMSASTWIWIEKEAQPSPAQLKYIAQTLPEVAGVLSEGGYIEVSANVINVPCQRCALWYRAWEDAVRPCPCCTKREAREDAEEVSVSLT